MGHAGLRIPDVSSDSITPQNVESLDKVEMAPQEVPDSVALDTVEALDSVDEVSDSVEVVQSPRCGTFHAGGIFGEACFQACREACRCACCGLLHEDYDLLARWLHKMEKFDCESTFPMWTNLNGNTILLPEHVVKKLEENFNTKKLEEAKMKQQCHARVDDGIQDQ
uniref:Uncharacterized protein n=1 Tax=Setaria viridis TaxID=4556 RepID=A0A4U6U3Z6_SETVI|nr:hypothetical protein SEVIR_6G153200v2 [Setaria viridis]